MPTPKMKSIENQFYKILNNQKPRYISTQPELFSNSDTTIRLENHFENDSKSTDTHRLETEAISKLSQLAIAFVMSIESYIISIENSLRRNIADLELNNHFLQQGVILLGTVHAWMLEEIIMTPKILTHINNETEAATKLKGTSVAREKMKERNMANHDEILKEYQKIKEESPEISKNKAAEIIFKKGIGNLTFMAIRGHIPKG